jgi:hypothetical protein
MRYGHTERILLMLVVVGSTIGGQVSSVAHAGLAPETIIRQADRSRGLTTPYRFIAHIHAEGTRGNPASASREPSNGSVVEVRSDGFAKQLIRVLQPTRGDVLLKADDTIWLRPRKLHRLTRIPPELRVFSGAATADVTAVDLLKTYTVTTPPDECPPAGEYVFDLVAARAAVRYPRARYRVTCESLPRRLEFMTMSGKVLKAIDYAEFADVFGARIATRLVIEDLVVRDVSIMDMSEFALLNPEDVAAFSPDYLLSLPDAAD